MLINSAYNPNMVNFQSKYVMINGKKYIPISEHKGPVLKLTKAEEKKVVELREQIADAEIKYFKLAGIYAHNINAMNKRDYKDNVFCNLRFLIENLKNEIKEIQQQRYEKQLAKAAAKEQGRSLLH